MNRHRPYEVKRCGAADSKYCSRPEQLDLDHQKNLERKEHYKSRVKNLLMENPANLKENYHRFIEVLREVKEEFGL